MVSTIATKISEIEDGSSVVQVKLFAEAFQAQLAVNLIKILQADTRAALAEAVKATDNGLKVRIVVSATCLLYLC